ncbi:Teichoic acid translocation permease protein TagG [Rosistilla ulvae]|uniref:Transport permease protein n=1 Tax=Rosistilla ulvae TaxID=1930277 RepID=A0A517M0E9_9BACT|nr:ABC transporter permease [Rosistilla ulvae]QDS88351.1 Teichoic acid translocation permease protein TagG [Rosistilla ulvae]
MTQPSLKSIRDVDHMVEPEATVSDAMDAESCDAPITVIERSKPWQFVNLGELYAYRDMLRFLTWRSIKARYAQSAIGVGWAVIQPAFQVLLFTLVFGRLANIDSDGVPYAFFSLVGLIPWTYFSNALSGGSNSLVGNASMISKVYFPRLILPLSDVVAKLFDFFIAFTLSMGVLLFFGRLPNSGILMLPYLILLMMVSALGLSLWLTALAIQFRDIAHALTFIVQLLMYASPVIYPTSSVPETYTLPGGWVIWPQSLYAINPMVGVVEGFRAALLGSGPMPYGWIAIGTVTATVTLLSGMMFFRSREKVFADVA